MKNCAFGLLSLLLLLVSACKKEERVIPPDQPKPNYEANIGGENYGAGVFHSKIFEIPGSGRQWELMGYFEDFQLYLAVGNLNLQSPPDGGIIVKKYYMSSNDPEQECFPGNPPLCDGAVAAYISKSGTQYDVDENIIGCFIEITENNITAIDSTVSGNYDVTLVHNGDTIKANGFFENARYTYQY